MISLFFSRLKQLMNIVKYATYILFWEIFSSSVMELADVRTEKKDCANGEFYKFSDEIFLINFESIAVLN